MIDKNTQMKDVEFLSLYAHSEPFDDEHFILKTFEIYVSYDNAKGCTRIIIRNADTKHDCIIYLDYIQRDKILLIKAAQKIINTNLLT